MAIFPVKTVALAANAQNTLVWSGTDFQKTLGYAQPEKPISMAFSVQNGTGQVCYVAISFQTRTVAYSINNRKSIVGIPANSTLRIASNLAPELASLGPDLVSVTLYLISAAAGNVVVSAEGFEGVNTFGVGSGGENIGQDQRSVLDYVIHVIGEANDIAGGSNLIDSYTIPFGKRAEIVSFNASIDATPFGAGDCVVILTVGGLGWSYTLRSRQFERAEIAMSGVLANAEAGNIIGVSLINTNPSALTSKYLEGTAIIREYFS